MAGAKTIEEANQVLWDFMPRFNERFAVPAIEPGLAYSPLPDALTLTRHSALNTSVA